MDPLAAANPYESPRLPADEMPLRPPPQVVPFVQRGIVYLFGGMLLAASYCTPLCPFQEIFTQNFPVAVLCVVVSTVVTSLLLDWLIVGELHCALLAMGHVAINAMLFTTLLFVVPGLGLGMGNREADWSSLALLPVLALFGLYGAVLCFHLAWPITTLTIWLARQPWRFAEEERGAK